MQRPNMLIILDGFGIGNKDKYDAVHVAQTPVFDEIYEKHPHCSIGAAGRYVGLRDGVMGNSQVGHLNLGAGRIVYQPITLIDKAIEDESFFTNEVFLEGFKSAKEKGGKVHIMGLVSDGCVHSSLDHLNALFDLANKVDFKDLFVHCFTDGRDTPPESGAGFVEDTIKVMTEKGVGKVASVIGRYWAMDRDNRWERVVRAYKALVNGEGNHETDPVEAIKKSYADQTTDEFIEPIVITENSKPLALIEDGDTVIFFNYRSDRPREITKAFILDDFSEFDRGKKLDLHYICMCEYDETFKAPVAFPQQELYGLFPDVLSKNGLCQLRIAETEKYPHVTFFYNGGEETTYPSEDRILVPSPKVATYDLQPEMSCYQVCEKVVEAIHSEKYDVIVLNFANPDMVGHTGVFEAAVQAVQHVDICLGKVLEALKSKDGLAIITADHGNAEKMWDETTNGPHTAHTTNKVPLILFNADKEYKLHDGKLGDIAPTLLEIMGLEKPEEMTGISLIDKE